MLEKLRNFMIESANIMFDDTKNDLRSLPKAVRLQILIVLSFVWSTVFSLYVFFYIWMGWRSDGSYWINHSGLPNIQVFP